MLRHRHPGRAAGVAGGQARAHARVEDRIRCAKDTGLGRFPSRQLNVNRAWLELALTACDLVAGRLTRGQRRLRLRIADTWPWRQQLVASHARLAALPQPMRL